MSSTRQYASLSIVLALVILLAMGVAACGGESDSTTTLETATTLLDETSTTVSGGSDDLVLVPNVTGKNATEAALAISSIGLTPVATVSVTDESSSWGMVVKQTPTAGTPVEPGSEVTIAIGSPSESVPTNVTIPQGVPTTLPQGIPTTLPQGIPGL